jgi:hypothetical protein
MDLSFLLLRMPIILESRLCQKSQDSYRAVFMIPGNFLSPGTYYLLVAAHLPHRSTYEVIEQAVVFEVSTFRVLWLL